LGSALAIAALRGLTSAAVPATGAATLVTLAACVALGCVGALAARIAAAERVLRGSIEESRRGASRPAPALWQRLWLDVAALIGSGLVYWLTLRGGFSAVVNPDANPTLTLSFFMFLAPALLWIGSALLLVRLHGRWVCRLRGRHAAPPTSLGTFLRASASRRGPAINRGLVVVALLLASAVEIAVFTATYDQQARIDAELTIGADVAVTAPPGAIAVHHLASRISRVPGVASTTALDHAYAYVGPDLQDTFGIDPSSFERATTLRNSYFLGGTAAEVVDRLRHRADAILVSRETITDYQLGIGDLVRLRVLDRRTGRFRVVPFHVAGVVQEFPSAPKDSFMVANLAYLERVTHDPGPNVVFARVHGDPAAVGRRVADATRPFGTKVSTRRAQLAQTVSSITSVDLAGISRIELVFAVALAVAAIGLLAVLAVVERRRELAAMLALGARTRTAAAFVWSELALVLVLSVAGAGVIGLLLSEMLVAMLRHVFDPPPTQLALPWGYLVALLATVAAAGLLAAAWTVLALRRLSLTSVLRSER
jgi:putative ABC transport system permease protein